MLALALCCGCRPDAPEPADTAAPTTPAPLVATLAPSALVPTVPVLSWDAPPGTTSYVAYGEGGVLDRRTAAVADPSAGVPVLGLAAGRSWSLQAVSEGAAGGVSGILTFDAPAPPPGVPRLEILEQTGGAEAPTGYVLGMATNQLSGPEGRGFVVIWRGDGAPVWWTALAPGHLVVTPSLGLSDGVVWWDDYDTTDTRLVAHAVRTRLDGSAQERWPLLDGHHGVLETGPDTLTWIARELRDDGAGGFVTADRLLEAPLDGVDAPRELIDLYDAVFGGTFQDPCVHTTLPTRVGPAFPVREWSHLNSIVHLPDLDALLIHLRWVDTVVLVDRSTGAVRWKLGGPDSDFVRDGGGPLWDGVEASLFSHAHLSDAWDGGMVLFDNGSHHPEPVSAIVEVAWDEGARTAREVFRWEDPEGRFVGILGDARRMPGGGYLGSWSTLGELTEISPDGEREWWARTDPPRALSRVLFLPTLPGEAR